MSPVRTAIVCAMLLLSPESAAAADCPMPPPASKDLDIPAFYADAQGSIVDPGQMARHDAAVQPLTAFLQQVTTSADASHRGPDPVGRTAAARCALSWIATWAQGNAWLGRMAQAQSEYQRKWDLSGVALAYLKVRPAATPQQRRVIEPWLVRFADAARAFFDDPKRRRNNHWYWLGLAVGATALATDSVRHWDMARSIMGDAARDIAADGTLPLELARGGRAIHYHAFAVMPIVVLAELGAARGEDWYGLADGAVHRLVDATLKGLSDPTLFDRLAATPQQRGAEAGAGWLHLYAARHPDQLTGKARPDMKPGHRWLGGDVAVLDQALKRLRDNR